MNKNWRTVFVVAGAGLIGSCVFALYCLFTAAWAAAVSESWGILIFLCVLIIVGAGTLIGVIGFGIYLICKALREG